MSYAKTVAAHLLKLNAIKLSPEKPFTWASGWQSPIYCDNRMVLSDPETRTIVKSGLAELIRTHYPEAEGVAGVATAGIPHAALIADELNLPMIYIRSSSKKHGRQNRIEGQVKAAKNWVVIEDLISTGGSVLSAVEALEETGANALGVVAIFTYGFAQAIENFAQASIDFKTLSNYPTLLQTALEANYISSDALDLLQSWQHDPANWGGADD